MTVNPVVREKRSVCEPEFRDALVLGLARCSAKVGRGVFADRAGRTTRGLDKLFDGSIPGGKGLLDLLNADTTVLDEVLSLYGLKLVPDLASANDDLAMLADATGLVAEHVEAMRDGKRDHNETIRLAERARPVVAAYAGMIDEADRLRGAGR